MHDVSIVMKEISLLAKALLYVSDHFLCLRSDSLFVKSLIVLPFASIIDIRDKTFFLIRRGIEIQLADRAVGLVLAAADAQTLREQIRQLWIAGRAVAELVSAPPASAAGTKPTTPAPLPPPLKPSIPAPTPPSSSTTTTTTLKVPRSLSHVTSPSSPRTSGTSSTSSSSSSSSSSSGSHLPLPASSRVLVPHFHSSRDRSFHEQFGSEVSSVVVVVVDFFMELWIQGTD